MKENKKLLNYYCEILKNRVFDDCGTALHNIIRTMRFSRHDHICGEDISSLDFGNIPLNEIYFSKNGEYASSFEGCLMREANFMSGHSGPIRDIAYSPEGKYVLTGSDDQTAILWDVETGKPLYEPLKGHTGLITVVAFSPDGKSCLTGSEDNNVIRWNVHYGERIKTTPLSIWNDANVSCMAFSSDTSMALVASVFGESIFLVNLDTGEIIDTLYHISDIHFNGCNCKNINADDLVKKILYQYNADV